MPPGWLNKDLTRLMSDLNRDEENRTAGTGSIRAFIPNKPDGSKVWTDEDHNPNYDNLGRMEEKCEYCDAKRWVHERISTSSRRKPKFGNCCANGKYKPPPLPQCPEPLNTLLQAQTAEGRHFRKNIRMYNNVLSMASVKAQWVRLGPGTSNFNPTMTVQGNMYHLIGAMVPPQGIEPAYLSVYIHDTDCARQTDARQRVSKDLRPEILNGLAEMLNDNNSYVQSFQ